MNLLNKLTIKNLKLNKKRTIVTIIGIMLSVALVTAVATMYSSMIKSLISFEVYEKGYFHVAYYDVPKEEIFKIRNTRGVEEVFLTEDIGYANLEESKNEYKPYIFVKAFTNGALKNLSVKLVEGRLPSSEDEILIPTHLKTNGRVVMNIGDTITLDIGKRVSYEGYELKQNNPYQKYDDENLRENLTGTTTKTYKIVGIIERPATNIENFSAPGYTFITYRDEEKMGGNVDVYTKYSKKGSRDYISVTASILGVDLEAFTKAYSSDMDMSAEELQRVSNELKKAKYDYTINTYLIVLESNPIKDGTSQSMGIVVIIVISIILVTSIFCIRNSFDISITEKIKQYGMLRSIGATKKQIKNNVFYEATILGLIGIPLGLLLGFLASYILVIVCNLLLGANFITGLKILLSYSWVAFLVSLVLGLVTIYFSAFKSARKASKVSPIESIRNSANIKINPKKIKCPKVIRKIFKVGGEISYKNMKRNKKKYRTTIVSIVVSVSIFVALSYFVNSAFDVVKKEVSTYNYNISLSLDGTNEFENFAKETVELNNIDNYAIHKSGLINIKNIKYNDEYIKKGKYDDEYIHEDSYISVLAVDNHQYRKYLKELKLNYDDVQNKVILIDSQTQYFENDEGKDVMETMRKYSYKKGEYIELYNDLGEKNIEICSVTTEVPFGPSFSNPKLVVSDELFEKLNISEYSIDVYFQSSNPNKLQDDIDIILQGQDYKLENIEENAKMLRNVYILVAIFLYGFIIVISLIGITNIFNTITTNMGLRKQEFAMLKSIGMTKHEFNNMIRFESIFIGFKALFFGIIIGVGLAYLIYLALEMTERSVFVPPVAAIILSIAVVYLLISVLMKYSLNKIGNQNTIETIRNENI